MIVAKRPRAWNPPRDSRALLREPDLKGCEVKDIRDPAPVAVGRAPRRVKSYTTVSTISVRSLLDKRVSGVSVSYINRVLPSRSISAVSDLSPSPFQGRGSLVLMATLVTKCPCMRIVNDCPPADLAGPSIGLAECASAMYPLVAPPMDDFS